MGRLLPVTVMGRPLPVTARPVRTIAVTRVVDEGTTAPADSEHSTDANPAGLYRTASASPIAAISRFAIRPKLDDRCHRHGGRKSLCGSSRSPEPPQQKERASAEDCGDDNVKPSTVLVLHRQPRRGTSA